MSESRLLSVVRCHRKKNMTITPIAHFRSAFPTKFGIPRQSGIIEELKGRIVFEPTYRNADALRGLEGFDYLWIVWEFSANKTPEERGASAWQPTVRPPLLGGNTHMGVFATRSPYRPNPLGLSSARIEQIELTDNEGPVIHVLGADLMDGTPIYDIKPYLPFTDCHPNATGGFAQEQNEAIAPLQVIIPEELKSQLGEERTKALEGVLSADPRPHYQNDPSRTYAMEFAGKEIKFRVNGNTVLVQ